MKKFTIVQKCNVINNFEKKLLSTPQKESFFHDDDILCKTLYLFFNRVNVVM